MAKPVTTKPYLIRAIHTWCLEQGYTPYINVVVGAGTRVPREFVKGGEIVLNLSPEATHQLLLGNEMITFSARFSGVAQSLVVPIAAVAAVYARENGQGMAFDVVPGECDDGAEPDQRRSDRGDEEPPPASPPSGRGHLTRIK